jgi:hypothetical protein
MEISNLTYLALILSTCDLIVKIKNLPGKARNEIKKKSTRNKLLKLTHNLFREFRDVFWQKTYGARSVVNMFAINAKECILLIIGQNCSGKLVYRMK